MPTYNLEQPIAGLADYLESRVDLITKEWMAAIHADPRISASEHLSSRELQNHFPVLLSQLTSALRNAPAGKELIETGGDAIAHGHERWRFGYNLDELIHELSRVRQTIGRHIFAYYRMHESFSDEDLEAALRSVSAFFDDIVCRSATELTHEEQEGLRGRVEEVQQKTEELAVGNEELRQLDESRLRLLRTVSHELRNLLNAVKLSGQVLAEDEDLSTRRRLALMLFRNVDHMDELLDDLLDFSSLAAGQKTVKLRRFAPSTLLEEVLYAYEPLAEAKGLLLEGVADTSLGEVVGDELKVKQIAGNLVSNALKYTSRGSVTVQIVPAENDQWAITVKDTGPGIPQDEIGRIFHEFHRVDTTAHQQGTGLGLAITKHLVDLLGGQIHVDSKPNEGSRFEVLLPRRAVAK